MRPRDFRKFQIQLLAFHRQQQVLRNVDTDSFLGPHEIRREIKREEKERKGERKERKEERKEGEREEACAGIIYG